jgi:hypothetical protein
VSTNFHAVQTPYYPLIKRQQIQLQQRLFCVGKPCELSEGGAHGLLEQCLSSSLELWTYSDRARHHTHVHSTGPWCYADSIQSYACLTKCNAMAFCLRKMFVFHARGTESTLNMFLGNYLMGRGQTE